VYREGLGADDKTTRTNTAAASATPRVGPATQVVCGMLNFRISRLFSWFSSFWQSTRTFFFSFVLRSHISSLAGSKHHSKAGLAVVGGAREPLSFLSGPLHVRRGVGFPGTISRCIRLEPQRARIVVTSRGQTHDLARAILTETLFAGSAAGEHVAVRAYKLFSSGHQPIGRAPLDKFVFVNYYQVVLVTLPVPAFLHLESRVEKAPSQRGPTTLRWVLFSSRKGFSFRVGLFVVRDRGS
jgi:hypothetical protein